MVVEMVCVIIVHFYEAKWTYQMCTILDHEPKHYTIQISQRFPKAFPTGRSELSPFGVYLTNK